MRSYNQERRKAQQHTYICESRQKCFPGKAPIEIPFLRLQIDKRMNENKRVMMLIKSSIVFSLANEALIKSE